MDPSNISFLDATDEVSLQEYLTNLRSDHQEATEAWGKDTGEGESHVLWSVNPIRLDRGMRGAPVSGSGRILGEGGEGKGSRESTVIRISHRVWIARYVLCVLISTAVKSDYFVKKK